MGIIISIRSNDNNRTRWKCAKSVWVKVVPYTSGKIWSVRLIFYFFLAVCLNISTVINIKILTNSNQQTQSYKFTTHIAAFLSVVLITEMLEICIQTSYDQNVQLILKSYLPVVYGTTLKPVYIWSQQCKEQTHGQRNTSYKEMEWDLRLWSSSIENDYCTHTRDS